MRARLFVPRRERKNKPRAAVVVLPQWNAQPDSHVEACRIFNGLGMTALRLTCLITKNAGRRNSNARIIWSAQTSAARSNRCVRRCSTRARQCVGCASRESNASESWEPASVRASPFLLLRMSRRSTSGVFNHVSGYFADVVWQGISTQHVRQGIETDLTVEELREFWKPISPVPFIPRLLEMKPRPMRFIAARYDLTFPVDLTRQVIAEVRRHGIDLDVVWLPCGHYTTAELPWKAIDAWKIATFFRKHL